MSIHDDRAAKRRSHLAAGESARNNKEGNDEAGGRRARFAKALARAEFGRFFWDETLDRRLKEAMRKPRPRPGRGA